MKNNFTFLFIFLFFTGITFSNAQSRNFDGYWKGTIKLSTGKTQSLALYVEDNNVYRVTTNSEGKPEIDKSLNVSQSRGYGEQLNFFWMNKGGLWTETQFSSLTYISSSKLSVHFMRHVSNLTEDKAGNTDWGYTGTGTLYKQN
ncbi:hypothetical protein ACG2LH_01620 [Zhouia sp. PK063]|uniref:hypothetical protein n=1 Tax=Zhouia sp. PK063 TaxID=3373602 RepID=UPI0037BB4526